MTKLFRVQTTPRIILFFLGIFLKIAASALSGIGFVLKNAGIMVTGTVIWLIFFTVLLIIAIPDADRYFRDKPRWLKPAASTVVTILLIVGIAQSAAVSFIGLRSIQKENPDNGWGKLFSSLDNVFGYNDATSLIHQATDNFLEGKNPYAETNIVTAGIQFQISSDKVTPLRTGRLADSFLYPDKEQMNALWQQARQQPEQVPPEIESKFNYPSGLFLLPSPFFKVGINDLRLVNFILFLLVLAYVTAISPRRYRVLFIIGVLISLELWNALAAGETAFLYFPFLLLAWVLYRKNLWVSALLMGVAVAIKQVPWFFLPFYLIVIFRTMGLKKVIVTAGIISGVFLAANLPFIIPAPRLWAESIIAPLDDPMFPLGVGVISVVMGQVINIQSGLLFTIVEILVGVVAVTWYYFNCRRFPDSGPVLAVLPLFFAWRSLWGYFFFIDIIILASIMINEYGKTGELSPELYPAAQDNKPKLF